MVNFVLFKWGVCGNLGKSRTRLCVSKHLQGIPVRLNVQFHQASRR